MILQGMKGTERNLAAVAAELSHHKAMRRLLVESISRTRAPESLHISMGVGGIHSIDRKVCLHIKVCICVCV